MTRDQAIQRVRELEDMGEEPGRKELKILYEAIEEEPLDSDAHAEMRSLGYDCVWDYLTRPGGLT